MKLLRTFVMTILLVLLGGIGWSLTHTQEIIDWWRLRDYKPSTAIASVANQASLNEYGTKLFYVHYPELLNKQSFSGKCSVDEVTIVLGCYITHTKIYIFDVEEPQLEGVEEVTAAHEMLHAAYDRLDEVEKARIDKLLNEVFASQTDERFLSTVENYRKRDAAVVSNELHSIIGTEIRELPTDLEQYYSQYFKDRLVVVEKAERYAAAFTELKYQITAYDTQLTALKAEIDRQQSDVLQLNQSLKDELANLERLRNDPEAYNAAVPSYNAKVRDYNVLLNELRQIIEEYNKLVAERNTIAIEERELVEAIDSRIEQVN